MFALHITGRQKIRAGGKTRFFTFLVHFSQAGSLLCVFALFSLDSIDYDAFAFIAFVFACKCGFFIFYDQLLLAE